mmetsp:Transcript_24658/g.73353  ORF Transcript_24658/g.73353 Transcript_24658/m.73353 type:complete len:204 (+) Transcript_24658:950-1561(+)
MEVGRLLRRRVLVQALGAQVPEGLLLRPLRLPLLLLLRPVVGAILRQPQLRRRLLPLGPLLDELLPLPRRVAGVVHPGRAVARRQGLPELQRPHVHLLAPRFRHERPVRRLGLVRPLTEADDHRVRGSHGAHHRASGRARGALGRQRARLLEPRRALRRGHGGLVGLRGHGARQRQRPAIARALNESALQHATARPSAGRSPP